MISHHLKWNHRSITDSSDGLRYTVIRLIVDNYMILLNFKQLSSLIIIYFVMCYNLNSYYLFIYIFHPFSSSI